MVTSFHLQSPARFYNSTSFPPPSGGWGLQMRITPEQLNSYSQQNNTKGLTQYTQTDRTEQPFEPFYVFEHQVNHNGVEHNAHQYILCLILRFEREQGGHGACTGYQRKSD